MKRAGGEFHHQFICKKCSDLTYQECIVATKKLNMYLELTLIEIRISL